MNASLVTTGSLTVPICGEAMHLLAERALWWPRRSTLIAADLHLGKEQAFVDHGIPMPTGVLDETLARLGRLLARTQSTRLVVLGDLIHRPEGLSEHVIETVARWRAGFDGEVELVPGNHDELVRSLPGSWRVARLAAAVTDPPFVHLHEAAPHTGGYALGGHLHPVVRLAGRVDRLLLPCFVIGSRHAVLPAFTRFSRGVRMVPELDERIYAIVDDAVVEVPSSVSRG